MGDSSEETGIEPLGVSREAHLLCLPLSPAIHTGVPSVTEGASSQSVIPHSSLLILVQNSP